MARRAGRFQSRPSRESRPQEASSGPVLPTRSGYRSLELGLLGRVFRANGGGWWGVFLRVLLGEVCFQQEVARARGAPTKKQGNPPVTTQCTAIKNQRRE